MAKVKDCYTPVFHHKYEVKYWYNDKTDNMYLKQDTCCLWSTTDSAHESVSRHFKQMTLNNQLNPDIISIYWVSDIDTE